MTQDDAGRIYRNTNESALHVDFVPTPYYVRNPNLLRTRGSYESLEDDDNAVNTVWPVRPNPGTNRAYQTGIDRPDGTLAKFTSVCAPLVYRGDRLPAELYGNVFVAEPAANLVSRIVLDDDGTTLRARKAYERGRVPRLHRRALPAGVPVERAGRHALHRRHVSRRHPAARRHHRVPARPHRHAQARAADRARPHLPRRARDDAARHRRRLASATPAQLVAALSHPNGWWRDTAQQLLVERGDASVVPALTKLAASAHRLADAAARAVDARRPGRASSPRR